jgi:hypothetical protein
MYLSHGGGTLPTNLTGPVDLLRPAFLCWLVATVLGT